MMFIDKSDRSCQIIDVTMPEDRRVRQEKSKSIKILQKKFEECGA